MNSTLGRVGLVGALILCGALTGCGDNGNDVGFEEPPDFHLASTGSNTTGSGVGGSGASGGVTGSGVGGSGASGGVTGTGVGGSGGVTGTNTGIGGCGASDGESGGCASGGVTGVGGQGASDGESGSATNTGTGSGGTGGYPACSCETLPNFIPETGETCECVGACHFSGCVDGYNFLAACNGETWQVEDLSCEPTHCGPQVGVGLHCAPDEVCRVLEGSSLEYSCEPNPCLNQQVNQPTSCECAASLCESEGFTCEMREEGTVLACCEDCN